jgi:glycolate oxidase FAD binding subunit
VQPALNPDNNNIDKQICLVVKQAAAERTPLRLRGGDTKAFYGRVSEGQPLDLRGHNGIVSYEPSELVVTARAGTLLMDLESDLTAQGQMLGFEPPQFGDGATLGGTIACGLSGPRRPYAGSARDFVLGTRIINGRGELLRFGGQVMKNVAGYDISRLSVGAMGTLGLIVEVSMKVLPIPAREVTVGFSMPASKAIRKMNEWAGQPIPISGTCHHDETLYVRVSGSVKGVDAAIVKLDGELLDVGAAFWHSVKEHRHSFFVDGQPQWRISAPQATPPLPIDGEWLIEWGGGQRWLKTDAPTDVVRKQVEAAGGHATLFRGGDRSDEVFHPLTPGLFDLHRNLKNAFDPQRIFNPGRLYRDL